MRRILLSRLPLLAMPLLGACSDMCGNAVVRVATSPDGRFDAVLFQRDCGATTGFSTQISVLRRGDRPSGTGNAFIADTDHGRARGGPWGGPWAGMRWLGPDRLLVRYARHARIFRQSQPKVWIVYQEADAAP